MKLSKQQIELSIEDLYYNEICILIKNEKEKSDLEKRLNNFGITVATRNKDYPILTYFYTIDHRFEKEFICDFLFQKEHKGLAFFNYNDIKIIGFNKNYKK